MGSGRPLPCICREMMGGGRGVESIIQRKWNILKEVHAIFDIILFGTLYTPSPFSMHIGRLWVCVSATERKEMASLFYSETINVLRIILCCEKEIWQRFMNTGTTGKAGRRKNLRKMLLFTSKVWGLLQCGCVRSTVGGFSTWNLQLPLWSRYKVTACRIVCLTSWIFQVCAMSGL